MAKLEAGEVLWLAKSAGFTDEQARVMTVISYFESGWDTSVLNDNSATGDLSYGLWQINMIGAENARLRKLAYGIKKNEELFDPATNAKAARITYGWQKYSAWSVWNHRSSNSNWGRIEAEVRNTSEKPIKKGRNWFVKAIDAATPVDEVVGAVKEGPSGIIDALNPADEIIGGVEKYAIRVVYWVLGAAMFTFGILILLVNAGSKGAALVEGATGTDPRTEIRRFVRGAARERSAAIARGEREAVRTAKRIARENARAEYQSGVAARRAAREAAREQKEGILHESRSARERRIAENRLKKEEYANSVAARKQARAEAKTAKEQALIDARNAREAGKEGRFNESVQRQVQYEQTRNQRLSAARASARAAAAEEAARKAKVAENQANVKRMLAPYRSESAKKGAQTKKIKREIIPGSVE